MGLRRSTRKLLGKFGYELVRIGALSHHLERRKFALETYKIDIILDVGANIGQFAREMRRRLGFGGRIVSFEPLSDAFAMLEQNASTDGLWRTVNCALGESNETREINVAGNSQSSSLLNMLQAHSNAAPESKYIGTEPVKVKTLDSIFDTVCLSGDSIYLKIDTQGFEESVLKGARNSLNRIDTIQIEMSFVPLYEGQLLFSELYSRLFEDGYHMVSIEPVFSDIRSGELLQVDGIFHRF